MVQKSGKLISWGEGSWNPIIPIILQGFSQHHPTRGWEWDFFHFDSMRATISSKVDGRRTDSEIQESPLGRHRDIEELYLNQVLHQVFLSWLILSILNTAWWFFTNPSEKMLVKMGSSSPIFGVKNENIFETST